MNGVLETTFCSQITFGLAGRGQKWSKLATKLLLNQINEEFSFYVKTVVLLNVGSKEVRYRVCREENGFEDCSEEDAIATFDFKFDRNSSWQDIAVNSKNFRMVPNLFLPYSWQLSKPSEVISTWTRIEIVEGSDDISPPKAPPFFVYRFTRKQDLIAHLPNSVKREQYGDLVNQKVLNYCDRCTIDNQSWDFGHISICGESKGSGNTTLHQRSED